MGDFKKDKLLFCIQDTFEINAKILRNEKFQRIYKIKDIRAIVCLLLEIADNPYIGLGYDIENKNLVIS